MPKTRKEVLDRDTYLKRRIAAMKKVAESIQSDAILDVRHSENYDEFQLQVIEDLYKQQFLERVGKGVYIDVDWTPDDFLLRQLALGQGIYSGPTALYLWGLSDEFPYDVYMTFKRGYKLPKKESWRHQVIVRQMSKEKLNKFVMIKPVSGTKYGIKVYSPERTLAEMLREPDVLNVDLINSAYRKYLSDTQGRIAQLVAVATKMGMGDKVRQRLEIMM